MKRLIKQARKEEIDIDRQKRVNKHISSMIYQTSEGNSNEFAKLLMELPNDDTEN